MEKLWNHNYVKLWIANFMLFFSFMLLTPLLPLYLSDTFQADKATIGIVLSGYTLVSLMVRPFSGFFVDTFPRKVVLLVTWFFFCALFAGYLVAGTLTMFAIFRTLHGAPYGAVTVANSTVAIDVLHPERRSEGIGYYGLSNNLATAISPSVAICIFQACHDYNVLFLIALGTSFLGIVVNSTVKVDRKEVVPDKGKLSFDRFFLVKGWSQGLTLLCYAYSYGVLATYLAIYGKEELGIIGGSGLFFFLLCVGLMVSRIVGARSLRLGQITHNATIGSCISFFGYLLFAALHNEVGFYGAALVIGLGNGHMFPAFQNIFIDMAPHSQRGTANSTMLTSWDIGVGLGVVLGGMLSEHAGYHSAFWSGWVVNALGLLFYLAYSRDCFLRHKLR
ncbi:MAG: MFS transporter [Bacteroidales bacterium]|nr:MFS transporter [Bacteroidales bacterium]